MANKTIDCDNHEEYARVVDAVSCEDFDKARNCLEGDPQQFYNQLVVLLWSAEDWETCGEDFEPDSIQRNIFDTIQGIASRDKKSREFMALRKQVSAAHPEWSKRQVLDEARKQFRRIKQRWLSNKR